MVEDPSLHCVDCLSLVLAKPTRIEADGSRAGRIPRRVEQDPNLHCADPINLVFAKPSRTKA